MVFKQEEVIKGAIVTGIGIFGINWAFSQPCNISANPSLGLTQELAQLLCLSADPKITIVLMVASAAIFAGITKIIQNL